MSPVERFTDRARRAYAAAQEEARRLGHRELRPDHLLLGLLHVDDGEAAAVLRSFELDVEPARAKVADELGRGPGSPAGALAHAAQTERALEAAETAMLAWEHDHIESEHLLFGVLQTLPASTHRVLLGLHVEPALLSAALASEMAGVERPRVFPALKEPVQRLAREHALRSAAARHPSAVPDSGDLLIGLAEQGHGVAARALAELGIDGDALRAAVDRARSRGGH